MRKLSIAGKLLVTLPLLGLTFFGLRWSMQSWQTYQEYVVMERNSAVLQQIGSTVHKLQKERGMSAGFLNSKGMSFAAELPQQRKSSDSAIEQLQRLLQTFDASPFGPDFQGGNQTLRVTLWTASLKLETPSATKRPPLPYPQPTTKGRLPRCSRLSWRYRT